MDQKRTLNSTFQALRKKAELILTGKQIEWPDFNELDLMSLINEIEVQYVELELQNQELRQTSHDLEESRNKFFELYQTAPVAFVTVNNKGLIEQINEAAVRLLAGTDHNLVGRSFASLIVPGDQQSYVYFLKNLALRKAPSGCELRLKINGQPMVHVHLQAKGIYDDKGEHRQWRFGMIDIIRLKKVEEELRQAHDELEARVALRTTELNQRNKQLVRMTNELTIAEQRERRRLADLLHDNLQQLLAGARLNLDVAVQENHSSQDSALSSAYELVSQALETSRALSAELSPPVLHMHGLVEALKWLADWMEKTHKLHVDLKTESQPVAVQEDLKILLFQAVRELLFNVVKHAGTTAARVEIRQQGENIVILVHDEGKGFDSGELWRNDRPVDKAYGLFNIRERLLLLGGDFDIQSPPGRGTTIRISVPLQSSAFGEPEQTVDASAAQYAEHRVESANQNSAGNAIRVMLVDDHGVMRKGLSSLLSRYKDIDVVAEAADGVQAVEVAQHINPDIILMDINMPVMDGIKATHILHSRMPRVPIIALSMHDDDLQAAVIKKAGAASFLSKSGHPDAIIAAIRQLYHDMRNDPKSSAESL